MKYVDCSLNGLFQKYFFTKFMFDSDHRQKCTCSFSKLISVKFILLHLKIFLLKQKHMYRIAIFNIAVLRLISKDKDHNFSWHKREMEQTFSSFQVNCFVSFFHCWMSDIHLPPFNHY